MPPHDLSDGERISRLFRARDGSTPVRSRNATPPLRSTDGPRRSFEASDLTSNDLASPPHAALPRSELAWRTQLQVLHDPRAATLSGDKIDLPASALTLLFQEPASADSYGYAAIPGSGFDPISNIAATQSSSPRSQRPTEPLTFRLTHPHSNRHVYAGVREFSSPDDCIRISRAIASGLGIAEDQPPLLSTSGSSTSSSETPGSLVHIEAVDLPKGTFVRLRPLHSYAAPEDWQALLSHHLQGHFTTLTRGQILHVPAMLDADTIYEFRVDEFHPEGVDGVVIVNTDLEVDIEALDEEQARETLRQRTELHDNKTHENADGLSAGGAIQSDTSISGTVQPNQYVDFNLDKWDRTKGLRIELDDKESDLADLYMSPFAPRQRHHPRQDEHVFAAYAAASGQPKTIALCSDAAALQDAESIFISVHGYRDPETQSEEHSQAFTLSVSQISNADIEAEANANNQHTNSDHAEDHADEEQCSNCHQWIPKRTMMLHENFCRRNNITCPKCHRVFQARSAAWTEHWHCDLGDDASGDSTFSKNKHIALAHTPARCPGCDPTSPSAARRQHEVAYPPHPRDFSSILELSYHRVIDCPAKPILCQFCHLQVPQQGPTDPHPELDPAVKLSGLTPHEYSDGARTTECPICGRIIRLRDAAMHGQHHALERRERQTPHVCSNPLCGRACRDFSGMHLPTSAIPHSIALAAPRPGDPIVGASVSVGNHETDLRLCPTCFGPLYAAGHDPQGRALKRRIERRFLSQILTGCGQLDCRNEWCKTARATTLDLPPLDSKAALAQIRPLLDTLPGLTGQATNSPSSASPGPMSKSVNDSIGLYFCVSASAAHRRRLVRLLAADPHGWAEGWWVRALEEAQGDESRARTWLEDWAPRQSKTTSQ